MESTKNVKAPVFFKYMGAIIVGIIVLFFYFLRDNKTKESFDNTTGVLQSITNSVDLYPNRDSEKFRYLQVTNYPFLFELFVGKATGDFSPKFENVDALKAGDTITVYYSEDSKVKLSGINNLVHFIDRGKEAIYINGSPKKILLLSMIGICILIII